MTGTEPVFRERPALRIEQAIGIYFVTSFKARDLLDIAYSDRLQAIRSPRADTYELEGTQRRLEPKRLRAIGDYISRIDSAFPNTIILAANFRREDGNIEEDEALRWSVRETAEGWRLVVPTRTKLAAIIDGQHRLFGYAEASPARLDDDLVCSVFIDLPKAVQAGLFATINSTQTPVNPSLTYELFGYNISEEPSSDWTPDKVAVFLTRKLGNDAESPLAGRIIVAPEHGVELTERKDGGSWMVSTAAVVTGILKLISSNPKRDANFLLNGRRRSRDELRGQVRDGSPLRDLYIDTNDQLLYVIVRNYLNACEKTFWRGASPRSFIYKTIGINALFAVLRRALPRLLTERDLSTSRFLALLRPAGGIDFAEDRFRGASGGNEVTIRNAIEETMQTVEMLA